MYLADWQIEGELRDKRIVIDGMHEKAVQPVSVDLRLGAKILVPTNANYASIDDGLWRTFDLGNSAVRVQPGCFFLGSTQERVELPDNIVGAVRDKSTLARRGLFMSHGLIDPGFRGHITLEFVNHSPRPFLLREGMWVAQMTFERVAAQVARPYGHKDLHSHYQDQGYGPQIARGV